MITSFANPRVAQAFVDYMATQGIILTIQQHDQSDVWLADESQAGRVQAELVCFPKTRRSTLSGPAGNPDRPTVVCATSVSLPLCVTTPGRLPRAILLVCIPAFVLQNIIGDRPIMLLLAWPWRPVAEI